VIFLAAFAGAGLLGIFAFNRWRDLTLRTSRQRRRLAARTPEPLVLVYGLAANTASRAGVVLIRALRRQADELGVGVTAVARDDHLLVGYCANGFRPGESALAGRLLYRPPGAIPTMVAMK